MKQKKKNSIMIQVKAARKQSRHEEITTHGKPINFQKIIATKKIYNRKKNKADDEVLPYFFIKYNSQNFNIENFLPDRNTFCNWYEHRITFFNTKRFVPGCYLR